MLWSIGSQFRTAIDVKFLTIVNRREEVVNRGKRAIAEAVKFAEDWDIVCWLESAPLLWRLQTKQTTVAILEMVPKRPQGIPVRNGYALGTSGKEIERS